MMTTGGDYLNNSLGTKGNQAGKRCHSLNNSADFGNRFHTSFLDGEFNTSVRFARSAHKTKTTKTTRTFILNQTKFIVNPASQFLEEMYLKYSKSLQKYFSRNKEGMKLYGNKYFENISIDAFLKTRNKSQQKMLAKMKNPNNFSYAGGPNTTVNESEIINEENKIIPTNLINTSANANNITTNLNFNDELHDDEFFLTPLPNKSRKLLNTKKEKKDFLNAERAAVMMRTFEYTHGVRSRVGFSQYKRMLEEEKEKLIALMLKAANKIQRWWKKKKSFKRVITEKESEEDSEISKKYSEYNMILEKKRKENFINKIVQYVHRVNKPNKIYFLDRFREYAMNCRKFPFKKKIRYMKDWYNNMFFCKEKRFQLLQEIKPKMKVKGTFVYMTKNCYYIEDCSGSFDSNDSIEGKNNNSTLNDNDRTNISNMNISGDNFGELGMNENTLRKGNTITNISNQNYPLSTNINSNNDIRNIQSDSSKIQNQKGIINNSTTNRTSQNALTTNKTTQMNLKDTKGNTSTLSSTSGNITSPIVQAKTSSTHQSRKKKAILNYYDQLEKVIMLQRCIKSFLQFKNYQRMAQMMEKNQRDSFGFINTPISLNHSKELYGRRNSNLRKSVKGNQLQLLQSFVKSYAPLNSPTEEYYNKITEEQDESKDSDDNLVNYNDSTHLTKGGQSERYRPKSIKEDLKNLNKEGAKPNSTKNKSHSHSLSMMFPQRASSKPKSKSKSKSKKIKTIEYGKPSSSDLGNTNSNSSTIKEIKGTSMNLEKKDNTNMILSKQAVRNIQGIKAISKNDSISKKESGTTSSRSTSSKGMTNYTTSTSTCTIGTTNKATTDESNKSSSAKYMKPPLSNTSRYAKPPKSNNEKLIQNKITSSTLSQNPSSSSDILNNKDSSESIQSKALKGGMRRQRRSNSNEKPEDNSNENESQFEPQKKQKEINSNVPSSYASTAYSTSYKGMSRYPMSQQRASFSNEMSLGYIPPFPLLNQSYFNFIVKPCTISCYVSKIRKKIFSDTLSSTLSKLLAIKSNNISKKYNSLLYISFHKWNSNSKQFLYSISKLQKIVIKYDIKKQLDSYFYRWKQKVDAVYLFCELIKIHVVKENEDFLVSKLKSEDKTKICFYSHNITSVSSTVYNTNQSQHFRYYCKINKSNNENDFLIIRMSLGYKLLRMVFTRGLGHELLLKLKRRRRRNKKSKTHYGLGKLQSKRHFEFLNFNSKLLLTTSKIVKKKVYCEFYHRLLYTYLYTNNNIEYDLEKSDICALIREGYKKGYFTILYNILRIRFNYCYEDSELTFNEFVERILQMKGRNVIQEEEKVQE